MEVGRCANLSSPWLLQSSGSCLVPPLAACAACSGFSSSLQIGSRAGQKRASISSLAQDLRASWLETSLEPAWPCGEAQGKKGNPRDLTCRHRRCARASDRRPGGPFVGGLLVRLSRRLRPAYAWDPDEPTHVVSRLGLDAHQASATDAVASRGPLLSASAKFTSPQSLELPALIGLAICNIE
jgi:hypothetical protein